MMDLKMSLKVGLILVSVFLHEFHAAPLDTMDMTEIPEDVMRFQTFLNEFEEGEIRLIPTVQLLQGEFPLNFEQTPHHIHRREKRDVSDPSEPGVIHQSAAGIDEDAMIRQYVRNEIARIFSCYQRLRCGYTKAQAEEDCKWLESSSLYHQLMKILGIKNYPKKTPSGPQGPQSQSHIHGGQPQRAQQLQQQQRHANANSNYNQGPPMQLQSDVSINPIHQNLQNGIRYGGARPGQYFNGNSQHYNSNANRQRRAYDSFYTDQQLAPISAISTST